MLEVRLIGKFDICFNGQPISLSTRASQSLFAYLILTAGTQHRREKLAGIFWPDLPEKKARTYLRQELWRIRKSLAVIEDFEYLVSNDIVVSFNVLSDYWSDVDILKKLNDHSTIRELTQGLSLIQGELLPDFYDDWVIEEREYFQSLFERRMGQLLGLLENEKRWHEVVDWAEFWVSSTRTTEAPYQYLMLAYDALDEHRKVDLVYERCMQALRELELKPSEKTRSLAFRRDSTVHIPIPLTSFIGRDKELQEVAALFNKSRLVTLTGSGGVGKTRLAIQVVAEVLHLFPDGVWFLDLALLQDSNLVGDTLAGLLGLLGSAEKVPVNQILIQFFSSRKSLVILDNCEHLIEACARLTHLLLTSCRDLSILATSRESLKISGEISYRVPSLETPNLHITPIVETIEKIESVKLFIERAQVNSPSFTLGPQNVFEIAQICRRLDGIPLAIELAAARTNLLTVEQISRRLDDRFNLLTNGLRSALPRHQTLRAMIEWSYELLSEKEQLLFSRLAVFSGGWALEDAEEICSVNGIDSDEVLDLLTELMNKSLLTVDHSTDISRYRRLETIRQFARGIFFASFEVVQLQDKHLNYFLKKVEELEPYLMGAEQSEWMDYLEMQLENLRSAFRWAVSNKKGGEALRLFGSLTWFFYIHCHCREGLEWFRQVEIFRNDTSKTVLAKAIGGVGWLNYATVDPATASIFHQESASLYRELDDLQGLSTQLQFAGVNEYGRGNLAQARTFLEESLSISRRIQNKPAMPRVLMHLGYFLEVDGDHDAAWQNYEESLRICREIGEGHLTMVVLTTMGHVMLTQKNRLLAREYFSEALEIGIRLKNKRTIAETILNFAEVLCMQGRYLESARLQGFAESLFKESDSLTKSHLEDIKRTAEITIKDLGKDSYREEFEAGRTLELEQAVEIALKK